jgi:hypothetical protein
MNYIPDDAAPAGDAPSSASRFAASAAPVVNIEAPAAPAVPRETLPPRAVFPRDLPTTRHRKIMTICCGPTACMWGIADVDGLNYESYVEEELQLLPTDIRILPWLYWR